MKPESERPPLSTCLVRLVLIMLVPALTPLLQGCAAGPRSFATPEEAEAALVQAARDRSTEDLSEILGPGSQDIISSGDPVADRQGLDRFVEAYDQKHQLVPEEDGRVALVIGGSDWPLPIPLVKTRRGGKWYFDADAGRDELVNRRIGRNELNAIQVCLAIVDAQREYARRDPQGTGLPVYAAKFASTPGARDGLYWPPVDGEEPSPLGPLLMAAAEEGYKYTDRVEPDRGGPQPYHGYRYRLLTSQGTSARGGAFDYVVNGKMLGGFGLVAFPAEYANSGIMTFIVSHDGVVYERDLGADTPEIAMTMSAFDPDPEWTRSTVSEEESGGAVATP